MSTEELTPSEQPVFEHLVLGWSNHDIARALGSSEKTIKAHVTRILKKFNCESRSKLIAQHYQSLLAKVKS